jgi:pimeloyl-ACP methyl ester carboxylesterase
VVREIANDNAWELHYLCSEATDAGARGSYTYKRADEILALVAEYRRKGVPARRIFLLGHSAGGWSSLMAARKDPSGFNAIVAFAPAFAGPRSEEAQFPIWRRQLQPQQIAYLAGAPRIDALIFAFDDDTFDRPEDLAPLRGVPGLRIVAYNDCAGGGHRTVYTACFRQSARQQIEAYIKARLGRQ